MEDAYPPYDVTSYMTSENIRQWAEIATRRALLSDGGNIHSRLANFEGGRAYFCMKPRMKLYCDCGWCYEGLEIVTSTPSLSSDNSSQTSSVHIRIIDDGNRNFGHIFQAERLDCRETPMTVMPVHPYIGIVRLMALNWFLQINTAKVTSLCKTVPMGKS